MPREIKMVLPDWLYQIVFAKSANDKKYQAAALAEYLKKNVAAFSSRLDPIPTSSGEIPVERQRERVFLSLMHMSDQLGISDDEIRSLINSWNVEDIDRLPNEFLPDIAKLAVARGARVKNLGSNSFCLLPLHRPSRIPAL
jgi:hypothetical protein